ncbi:hypothetical protein F4553_004086 [Allocatelliglobosispora scoriae]|uniref:Alanine-rich protein n=1 Tax=Allocatelliglobosispora scoriae TaxID=643052 RepID=A0A841BNP6_9ACTN|nr:hypothetical protein [Allocatelliglobosispora scoriae]MBB5870707.1 hypothetical protein [Allocatelliglobosispora scoriae]
MSFSGHAYPWDVLGDPAFVDRVGALGVDRVTLAAAYHSIRAATPLHPSHQVVDGPYAALYRPVREEIWGGRRLRPLAPRWTTAPDPFGTAAATLTEAGLSVSAWIVLTHNTRLGTEFPQLSVVNCYGDRYSYALCPASAEVRDFAATLAAEAVRDTPVEAVSIEACGQLGIVHLGHHDKTDGAFSPHAQRILSICCCGACRHAWSEHGLEPGRVVDRLRAAVHGELEPTLADALLQLRHAAADELRRQVLSAVREQAPAVEVTLHAHPDPWATGSSPGLAASSPAVDAVLVPAWPTTDASVDLVAAMAARVDTVDAYLTVLPPADPDVVVEHGRRLVAAGAQRLSLYHLGLAPASRQPLFAQLISALSGGNP